MDEAPPLFPLLSGPPRSLAGSLVQDQFDVDTPWHIHDVHQLQYAFDGAMEVEDAGHRALLPRHLAAWIPAGVNHRTSLHRVRSMSVMFSPSMIWNAGDRVRIISVSALLREMIFEAARWPVGVPLDGKGQVYFAAFAMLLEAWIEQEAPLSLPTSTDTRLKAAMEFTRANLASASIGEACKAANLSVRTLRRRFQKAGISWESYRRRARLLAAIDLLDGTSKPVGEIAAHVGYENQGAFTKAFVELMHATPSAFRRRREKGYGDRP